MHNDASQKFFTVLVMRQKQDELGNHLKIGFYGTESELLTSILGKQFAQQRESNASGYELTYHLGEVSYSEPPRSYVCENGSEMEVIRRKWLYGWVSMCFSALHGWVSNTVGRGLGELVSSSARRQPLYMHTCKFCYSLCWNAVQSWQHALFSIFGN